MLPIFSPSRSCCLGSTIFRTSTGYSGPVSLSFNNFSEVAYDAGPLRHSSRAPELRSSEKANSAAHLIFVHSNHEKEISQEEESKPCDDNEPCGRAQIVHDEVAQFHFSSSCAKTSITTGNSSRIFHFPFRTPL